MGVNSLQVKLKALKAQKEAVRAPSPFRSPGSSRVLKMTTKARQSFLDYLIGVLGFRG
jgi:hypothetical protein